MSTRDAGRPHGRSGARRREPLAEAARRLLEARGVSLEGMARVVWELQAPYHPGLPIEECRKSVQAVVGKREVQYAIVTGLTLDALAEQGKLMEPLGTIVRQDHPLYGVDAILGLAIVNVYGSIGLSNYGYLATDRDRLRRCFEERHAAVTTFLDDLVAAVVAAACARIAHRRRRWERLSPGEATMPRERQDRDH